MRKVTGLVLFILINVSLLFAGGPHISLNIINLTGEDIYFTIKYNRYDVGFICDNLENKRNLLSPDQYNSTMEEEILRMFLSYDYDGYDIYDVKQCISTHIKEVNIYNKDGVEIFNKQDLLNAYISFIRDMYYRDAERYPGEFDWTGSYYFVVTKPDLRKANASTFSHRTAKRLELRENDNISSSVVKILNKGEGLTALQVGDVYEFSYHRPNWIKVKTADGIIGWCVSNNLEIF